MYTKPNSITDTPINTAYILISEPASCRECWNRIPRWTEEEEEVRNTRLDRTLQFCNMSRLFCMCVCVCESFCECPTCVYTMYSSVFMVTAFMLLMWQMIWMRMRLFFFFFLIACEQFEADSKTRQTGRTGAGVLGLFMHFIHHQTLTWPSQGIHVGWSVTLLLHYRDQGCAIEAACRGVRRACKMRTLASNEGNALHPWEWKHVIIPVLLEICRSCVSRSWKNDASSDVVPCFAANSNPFVAQLSVSSPPLLLSFFISIHLVSRSAVPLIPLELLPGHGYNWISRLVHSPPPLYPL